MAKIGIISFFNLDILDNGGKIRSYSIAKELSQHHKIFLLMPSSGKSKTLDINNLEILRLNVHNKNYFQKYFYFISDGLKFFKEAKIDFLMCELLWTLPIGVLISKVLRIPIILNEQNLEYLRSFRLKKYSRLLYSLFLEIILIRFCDYVTCVSQKEKKILEKLLNKNDKCLLLPNGTPTKPSKIELMKKNIYRQQILNEYDIQNDKLISIFIGDLSYSPNTQALVILNSIAKKYNNHIKIFIIGKNKNSAFMKKKYKNLFFTGFIKNLNKFLYGADFTIIPIESGGGTNLKIYEALAVGLPIITSNYAIQNIEIIPKSLVLLADRNYENKVESMIKILNDNKYKRKINNSYNWDDNIRNLLIKLNSH